MAVSANDFWQQLTRIGILDAVHCRAWIDRYQSTQTRRKDAGSTSSEDGHPNPDAIAVAQFLIANRVVTKFQSQRLIAGRANELRVGDYLVLDRCDQMPLSRWYRAKRLGSDQECFLYPCTDALTSSRWVDTAWLNAHATVEAEGLQPITIVTLATSDPWRGAIASEFPLGRSLHPWAQDQGPIDHLNAARIGRGLSAALAVMHEAGMVHGEVRPSRIWCGDDRSLWLLRDAGRPPAHPLEPVQEHRWFDDDSMVATYAAPELVSVSIEPTPQSDLFSLAAILFELVSGKTVRKPNVAYEPPFEVIAARDAGAVGDPFLRTLAYALDPNPESRFPDLRSFSLAIEAVISAYETNAVSVPQGVLKQVEVVEPATIETSDPAKVTSVGASPLPTPSPQAAIGATPAQSEKASKRSAESGKAAAKGKPTESGEAGRETPSDTQTTKVRRAEKADARSTDRQGNQEDVSVKTFEQADVSTAPVRSPVKSATETVRSKASSLAAPIPPPPAQAIVNSLDASPSEPPPSPLPISAPTPSVPPSLVETTGITRDKMTVPAKRSALPTATLEDPSDNSNGGRAVRRRKRRSRRGPMIVGGAASLVLLVIIGILLRPSAEQNNGKNRPFLPPPTSVTSNTVPRPVVPAVSPSVGTTSNTGVSAGSSGFELVDDARLLWASPWSPTTQPPSLALLPPGAQWIVSLRLGRMIGAEKNSSWLEWLAPELGPAIANFEKRSGLKASEVADLKVALMSGADGVPKVCYAVTPTMPVTADALQEAWGASPSRTAEGKTIYTSDDPDADAYFVSESADKGAVSGFAFGPLDMVQLIAENDGEAIPLPRSLQQLWDTTSKEADVVSLIIPNFLFADGRGVLQRYAPVAIEPLRAVLIPDVAGAVVSMSVVEHWYTEVRLNPSGTVSAPGMLQILEPKIAGLPKWAEDFAVGSSVDPSWRAMAIRLPQYMRSLTSQTRFGVSETLPMFNFYLPAEAGPQVALATVLALSTTEAAEPMVVAAPTETMAAMTLDQMLDANFSVAFDQESLEFAVNIIRDEFSRSLPSGSTPPKITIVGGDLQKSGITQNQQIRNFQMREKPLREALTELARQANPDKSVTSLTEEKQSLVWVPDPASSPEAPSILITTRPVATEKGYVLPKEFKAAP